jgi:glucosylceramidase
MKTYIYIALIILISFNSCTSNKTEKPVIKPFSTEGKKVSIYTTAQNSNYRLTLTGISEFKQNDQMKEAEVFVFVNPNKTFQTFLGIGGAITDASAEVFAKLPSSKQEEFLASYYNKERGIGYSLARTNINSCDFSSGSYTYINEGDKELESFNIEHDRQFKIPMIKKAIQAAGGKLLLYASPWSPPAFMKSNNNMLRGGKLLPDFNSSWATYFTRFIKAYESEEIPVWGISVQNEPMAVQTWESCVFSAEEERDFLKNFLGPIMEQQGLSDKKIIVWDHNRDFLGYWISLV